MELKPLISTILVALVLALVAHGAIAAGQCLSGEEMADAARMASVMGIGAAVQKCGTCLGERYATTVQHYEDAKLLKDFWVAQAKIKGQARIDQVDDLVRSAARNYSAMLSADCEACRRLADSIDALGSGDGRAKLYDSELHRLGELPAVKNCH